MEIEYDLLQRLVNANAVDSLQAQNLTDYHSGNGNETIVLNREITSQMENGCIVGRYLQHWTGHTGKDSRLDQLKETSTPPAKLSNWNIIIKELEKAGIEIDADYKRLIIAGDPDIITDLLKQISDLSGEKGAYNSNENDKTEKKAAKKTKVKEGVDILSMDPNKKPTKWSNSLEIILNTLCRAFKMKPKQCAALLTNNNQYLMHSVVKGLKGNFEPVISWYEELNSISEYFAEIVCLQSKKQKKPNTLIMAMNAVKTGCFSHNYEVAQWCLRFLTKLAYEFEDTICADPLYEWVS
jgi:hypothetical protein